MHVSSPSISLSLPPPPTLFPSSRMPPSPSLLSFCLTSWNKKAGMTAALCSSKTLKTKCNPHPFFPPFYIRLWVDIQPVETLLIAKRSTTNRHHRHLNQQGNKRGHFEMLGVDDSINETHSSKKHWFNQLGYEHWAEIWIFFFFLSVKMHLPRSFKWTSTWCVGFLVILVTGC